MPYRNEGYAGGVFAPFTYTLADAALNIDHSSNQTAGDKAFTAVAATNICTAATHGLVTGQIVHVTNSGGALPAGLSAATDYYINRIDADTFYLCSSYVNAVGGASVDITGAGTGTHTVHAPVLAYYAPAAGRAVRVHVIVAAYSDGTGGVDTEFGNLGAALTYGIRLYKRRAGAILYELTEGFTWNIKKNYDWKYLTPSYEVAVVAGSNDIFTAHMGMPWLLGDPLRFEGDKSDALVIWMNDDLSALTDLYFRVYGYHELGLSEG